MARPKTSKPEQLQLPFNAPKPRRRRTPVQPIDNSYFDAVCEREERREACEPFLRLHATGVAFVAIVVARAMAREVA